MHRNDEEHGVKPSDVGVLLEEYPVGENVGQELHEEVGNKQSAVDADGLILLHGKGIDAYIESTEEIDDGQQQTGL